MSLAVALKPLLELSSVTVLRGGRPALDHVSLSIAQGENVAILGPNGSGKSTLVKLITRDLYPAAGAGTMQILGQERWNVAELRSSLGIVSNDLQAAMNPEATALDVVVAAFTGQYGIYYSEDLTDERLKAADQALSQAEAGHLRDRVFSTLSSGEARRVMVARSLANDPRALLLDEPTTSLDLPSAHALTETLRRLARSGKTLLLVTHHLEEIVPEISRVIMLRNGRVIHDGPREEVMTSSNISDLFGLDVELMGAGPYKAVVR